MKSKKSCELSIFQAEPNHISYLLDILGNQLRPDNLPLGLAVNTHALELVEKMLSLGVKVDDWFSRIESFSHITLDCLEPGMTPLLVPVAHGNQSMVQLLLENKAPIE